MKGIESQNQESSKPPEVGMMENVKNTRERHFQTISDDRIHRPEDVSRLEHNADFEKAYSKIVGNRDLEKLVVKGFTSTNALPYAELTNRITEICVSLTDSEIDNIIRKFKEGLRTWVRQYASEFGLSGRQLENLQTGKWNDRDPKSALNPEGIKAVAHFVRARKKLHAVSPQTFPAFYFENYLDAQHKIDLMEFFEGKNGITINLIQIKSYEYGPGDIEEYTQSHRDWASEFTTDLASYEKNFSVEPEDSPRFKEFFEKVDNVTDVLMDVLTGDVELNKSLLYEKLGIGNLPKVEQIWILENYLPAVKEDLGVMISGGLIDAKNAEKISLVITELEKQLEKSQNHRKNLTGVFEIHSLCSVKEKVVSDAVIFKASRPEDRKAIKILR